MHLSKYEGNISGPNIKGITVPRDGSRAVGKTILLIDDEPTVTDICELMLKELGHAVIKAYSGPEGIKLYEANKDRIDLIISDFNMPVMNGQEVVERLRGGGHRVKVLLCSGGFSVQDEETAVSRGFNGFLRKPFTIDTLSEKITESLN